MVTVILSGSAFLAVADLSGLPFEGVDGRLLHFAAFFLSTPLVVSAYPRAPLTHILIALALLAGITELLQFTPRPGRKPDVRDFGFDILGIDTALMILVALRLVFRWSRPPAPRMPPAD